MTRGLDIPTWVALIVYALAVARVTGLVVADSITEPLRDALIARLDSRERTAGAFLADLIQCPWCAGMWISMVAGPLVWLWGHSPVMLVPALVLAFSQLTGMSHNLGR